MKKVISHFLKLYLVTQIYKLVKCKGGSKTNCVSILHVFFMISMCFQISLQEGCKRILVADSFGLMGRLVKTQKKAISLDSMYPA